MEAFTFKPSSRLNLLLRIGRCRRRLLLPLRGTLDVAGALPGAQFVGIARILVVRDGVEVGDFFHAVANQSANGGGAGHASFAVALLIVRGGVNGGAVVGQMLPESGWQRTGRLTFAGAKFRREKQIDHHCQENERQNHQRAGLSALCAACKMSKLVFRENLRQLQGIFVAFGQHAHARDH